MPVFNVTYESVQRLEALVEAANRHEAEEAVTEAAESGFFCDEDWENVETCDADDAEDHELPQYVVDPEAQELKEYKAAQAEMFTEDTPPLSPESSSSELGK